MANLVKFEGRIEQLEIHNEMMNTLAATSDSQIITSSILGGVAENISLSAQSVFLASQSKLSVQSVVIEVDDKLCVGQFHKALFNKNEYIVCIAKQREENLYELYSVLSPKTGLLHMQVGMGATIKTQNKSVRKGANILFLISFIGMATIVFWDERSLDNFIMLAIVSILFYFILFFIINRSSKSLLHFSEKSEKIFKMYGFDDHQDLFLLPSRHLHNESKLILESVYEYRKIIKKDPYPASYIEKQESSHG